MIVRTLILVVFWAILIVAAAPLLLACVLLDAPDAFVAYGCWAMRMSRLIMAMEITVENAERMTLTRPCIFMANHGGFIDGPLLVMLIPPPLRVLPKKSLFRIPVIGLAMRFTGFIPVDRKGKQGGKASVERAVSFMRERGYSFLIFPEGTRTRSGALQPFRRGGFFLALKTGAPIVPISIRGSYAFMRRGRWIPRKSRVQVHIHPAIPVEGFTEDTMTGLVERVRDAVASGLKESRV